MKVSEPNLTHMTVHGRCFLTGTGAEIVPIRSTMTLAAGNPAIALKLVAQQPA